MSCCSKSLKKLFQCVEPITFVFQYRMKLESRKEYINSQEFVLKIDCEVPVRISFHGSLNYLDYPSKNLAKLKACVTCLVV